MTAAATTLPYRPCAGVMLLNPAGLVFAGQRLDSPSPAWQMPQGGIDPGESPLEAAIRELGEEIGVGPDLVELVAEMPDWVIYDLPPELLGKVWGGRYRGQRQRWSLWRFRGADVDIRIDQPDAEFSAWRWIPADEMLGGIVPFKRAVYAEVVGAFRPWLAPF
ncbi:MAG: RNA pyrophosphohydrolase [Gemmobacter sp.]